MEEKKYTPKEAAIAILKKAENMLKNKLTAEEAVEKIKGPVKLNEVLPETKPEERDEVMEKLRALKKANRPLKHFMHKREMKKTQK